MVEFRVLIFEKEGGFRTEIRVRRPAVGRKDREKFISGKNKQNAVTSMVVTDAEG